MLEQEKYPEQNIAVLHFLKESNAIEGVYDDLSLEQAKVAWAYLVKQEVLSIGVILKTHKLLMLQSNLLPDQKGYFRQENVRVGGYYAPQWQDVPQLMYKWCFEAMREYPPIDPLILHVEFEKIHPFVDGNGRIGRMFMNWMFLKRSHNPSILIFEEKDRREYYKLFHWYEW